jgi:hypothetical protein
MNSLISYLTKVPTDYKTTEDANLAWLLSQFSPGVGQMAGGGWNFPSFSIGDIGGPNVSGPDAPSLPSLPSLGTPNIGTPNTNLPSYNGNLPSLQGGLQGNLPSLQSNLPSFDTKGPDLSTLLNPPSYGLPGLNLNLPGGDSLGKLGDMLKMPNMSVPLNFEGANLGTVNTPAFGQPSYSLPSLPSLGGVGDTLNQAGGTLSNILNNPMTWIAKFALNDTQKYGKIQDYWNNYRKKENELRNLLGNDKYNQLASEIDNDINSQKESYIKNNFEMLKNSNKIGYDAGGHPYLANAQGTPFATSAMGNGTWENLSGKNPFLFESYYKNLLNSLAPYVLNDNWNKPTGGGGAVGIKDKPKEPDIVYAF